MYSKVKQVAGVDDFVGMYNALYSNAADLQTQSLWEIRAQSFTSEECFSEL